MAMPTGGELKKLSHNLVELWNSIKIKNLEGIHKDILEFLDVFSGYARYYNLDMIMNRDGKNKEHGYNSRLFSAICIRNY